MYGKAELVKNHVRRMVGQSNPGDQILPELKLAKKLNVSHSTVRRALDELVNEGLLERRHGSGTYINEIARLQEKSGKTSISIASFFQTNVAARKAPVQKSLRFATYESAKEIALYHDLINEFEITHPGYNFMLDSYSANDFQYLSEYFHEIEAGNGPDIFYLNQNHLFWLIRNRYIRPMDDYAGNNFDNLDPLVKRAITYDKKTWIMPKNLHVFYLLYNKRLFDECGVEYPTPNWTWTDYLNAAKALTRIDRNDERKSIFGAVPHRDYLYLTPLVWSFGGELVDENGVVKLDSAETVDAIRYAVDLTMKHKVTEPFDQWQYWRTTRNPRHIDRPFSRANQAMYLKAGTDLSIYLHDKLDFGVAPIPSGPAGRFSPLLFSGWAVSDSTPEPDTCGRLLNYLGVESISTFARNNLSPFITEQTLQSYFTPDKPGSAYNILVMKNHLREYSFHGHYWPYLMGYIDQMFRNIFERKCSLKTATADAQKQMQSAMNNFLRWLEE